MRDKETANLTRSTVSPMLPSLLSVKVANPQAVELSCAVAWLIFHVHINALSQMAEAVRDVPQGSVIGPILFVIYVQSLLSLIIVLSGS